jgi:hypothetical protein
MYVGIFWGPLVYISLFGMLYQENSGNPEEQLGVCELCRGVVRMQIDPFWSNGNDGTDFF